MANEAESMANEVVSKDMQNPLNANEAVTNCYQASSGSHEADLIYIW